MRAGLCSLLVLVLLSLAASLPLEEEDEAPTAEDEEELYDDEAGEGEEVEYGFHPLDEFPETISVPVTEETDGGALACAPDSISLCLCSDGTLPPCTDDIVPECTCHKKSSLDVKGVEEEEPQDPAAQEENPTTTLPTSSTSPTTTITSSSAASTTTEASESVPTTESTPSSSPSNEPSFSSDPPIESSRPQFSSSEPSVESSRPQVSDEADSVPTSSGDGPVVPSPTSAPLPPAAPGLRRPGSHVPLRPFVPGQRRPFPQAAAAAAAAGGEVTPSDVEPASGHHQLSPGGHLGQATDGPLEKHPSVEASSLPPPPAFEEPIEPLLPGQPTSFCEDGTLARCDRRCLNGAPLPCAPGNEPSCFCRDGSTPARATPVLSQRLRPAAADSGRPGSDQPLNLAERFKPSRLSSSAEFTAARDATLY
jgi:hypothetical protein